MNDFEDELLESAILEAHIECNPGVYAWCRDSDNFHRGKAFPCEECFLLMDKMKSMRRKDGKQNAPTSP